VSVIASSVVYAVNSFTGASAPLFDMAAKPIYVN